MEALIIKNQKTKDQNLKLVKKIEIKIIVIMFHGALLSKLLYDLKWSIRKFEKSYKKFLLNSSYVEFLYKFISKYKYI